MPQPPGDAGTGVRCRIGSKTIRVDTAKECEDLGGTVVQPDKPKKVCGGCGAAMAALAPQFGMGDGDINGPWRQFLEAAARLSPDGKALLKSMAQADEHITTAVRDNPAALGDVTMALVTGAEFAGLVLSKSDSRVDKLKLPRVTQRYFERSIRGLRKGTRNKRFLRQLDSLERELKRWSRKTVAQIRARFLRD